VKHTGKIIMDENSRKKLLDNGNSLDIVRESSFQSFKMSKFYLDLKTSQFVCLYFN
jgi:hypothetical protein